MGETRGRGQGAGGKWISGRGGVLVFIALGMWLMLLHPSAFAQEDAAQSTPAPTQPETVISEPENPAPADPAPEVTYTVVSGDTMFAIAQRFGTTVEAISAANNIVDPTLLDVGQVLLIPDAAFVPAAGDPTAAPISTTLVRALPGDSLRSLATRYNQSVELLAAINPLTATSRLFPGQPITIASEGLASEPLRFGSVTAVAFPAAIMQGRTGRLLVTTSRPLTLTASLGALVLPIQSFSTDAQRHFSYLPVNSLWDPGDYPLTIGYVTNDGIAVSRTWQLSVLDGGYPFQQVVVPPDRSGLLQPEIVQGELQKLDAIWSPVTPQFYWTSIFNRPIDSVYQTTSPFGSRRDYNDGMLFSIHAGQDFGAPVGIPVLAPGNGVVVLAEPLQVRGNAVVIDHGGGVYSGYWHMSELRVVVGQSLNTGDVIGLVGNTGLSTGAHLHWELHIYGVAVDPMQFLEEALLQ